MFGPLDAAWRYGRGIEVPWREVTLPATCAALLFAFLGAAVVALLAKDMLRPMVFLFLISVLGYTLLRPDFGKLHGQSVRPPFPALLIGAVIVLRWFLRLRNW